MWRELGSFKPMFGRCMNYLSFNIVWLNGKLKMFIALSATFYLLWKTPRIPTQNNKWVLYWGRKVQRNLLQFASQGSRSHSDSVLWWNKYYGRHTSLSGRSLAAAHSSSLYILILLAILSLEIPQSSWQEICNPSLQSTGERGSPFLWQHTVILSLRPGPHRILHNEAQTMWGRTGEQHRTRTRPGGLHLHFWQHFFAV